MTFIIPSPNFFLALNLALPFGLKNFNNIDEKRLERKNPYASVDFYFRNRAFANVVSK